MPNLSNGLTIISFGIWNESMEYHLIRLEEKVYKNAKLSQNRSEFFPILPLNMLVPFASHFGMSRGIPGESQSTSVSSGYSTLKRHSINLG